MTGPPQIFDRALLRLRKARAAPDMDRVRFLLDHAAGDLADRLALMQRSFPVGLDLGAHGDLVSGVMTETGKVARMLRAPIVRELVEPADDTVVAADEEVLGLAPQSLDLVVSVLGLQLVNDLPGSLAQIRRVLKPDGLFLAAMLGPRTLEQLRSSFAQAEIAITGGLSPRVAPFADVRDLGQLLQRAGFALPVADTEILNVTYAGPRDLLRDLKAMGASNMLADRRKVPMTRALLNAALDGYHREFADPDGRVPATFEIITLTGWAPHESQQKPLRPGSAAVRLRDAIDGPKGSTR